MTIKNQFNGLKAVGKKRYYSHRNEEVLSFSNQNVSIEISRCAESISLVIDWDGKRAQYLDSPFLSYNEKMQIHSALAAVTSEKQLASTITSILLAAWARSFKIGGRALAEHFFRYDYRYKLLAVSIAVSLLFGAFTFLAIYFEKAAWWIFAVVFLFCVGNTFLYINNQGIRIKNNHIIIVDDLYFRKFALIAVRNVELQELKKEKRTNLFGFFHEFYHSSTYMTQSKYVYNHGRVFRIVFHLKDGTTRESYFGWLYREKNPKTVERVCASLQKFINDLNAYVK